MGLPPQDATDTPRRSGPEDDFEALFDGAPCGFLLVSSDWRIERANATFADWTGHDAAALTGTPFTDLLDVAGKIYVGTHFAPLLRLQGKFDEVALNMVRADGGKMPVLVNARERRDPDGALRTVLVSIFNATDRRRYEAELLEARNDLREVNETLERRVEEAVAERVRVEEALAHAQRMEAIGNLSAGIAHDFNNLLQVIGGNLQLLRKHVHGEAGEVRIERAADGVERGARLAGQLLAFGRRQTLDARVQDLGQTVRRLADNLIGTLGGEVELRVTVADGDQPDGLTANVDPILLENAVINLAVNARDAMRGADGLASGTITFAVERVALDATHHGTAAGSAPAGDYVAVTVSDTGSGIEADVARKVFEPFFTTKGPGEGTGLGLSMVYGFVTQSSGHVTIDTRLGAGTTIRLWLPFAEGGGTEDGTACAPAPVRGHETILLVEDDEAVLDVSRDLLEDLGYEVLTARDGTQALSVIEANKPIHLVLTDMVMPGPVRGAALAMLVAEAAPDAALLFTTGYAEMAAQAELRDGGHAILRKPFMRDTLASAVRQALDGRVEAAPPAPTRRSGSGTPRPPVEATKPRPASPPPSAAAPRVLMVEDEVLILMDASEMLRDLGCDVVEASSAAQAMARLREGPFDLLISDMELGDASGIDLARDARELDPDLRIAFASGRDDVPEAAGLAARLLRKPYGTDGLAALIEPLRR